MWWWGPSVNTGALTVRYDGPTLLPEAIGALRATRRFIFKPCILAGFLQHYVDNRTAFQVYVQVSYLIRDQAFYKKINQDDDD